jgi:hypothetical protein
MSATHLPLVQTAESRNVDDFILSAAVLLNVLSPAYNWIDPSSRTPLLFPVLGGLVLLCLGRYRMSEIVLVLGLLSYTMLIVLANGVESVRLGVVGAIFLGLLFSKSKAWSAALWVSVAYIASLLYVHTDGFVAINWTPVTENMSHNYFGEALCYVLMAAMLRDTKNHSTYLVAAILLTSAITAIFVPSRQVLVVGGFAAIYLLTMRGRVFAAACVMSVAVLIAGYLYGFAEVAAVEKFLQIGFDSPRSAVFSCYLSNLSVRDILIGSDHTASGACALSILMFTYLHSGYLETINQLGLLGVVMIAVYPVPLAYFAWRGRYNVVLALILAALYQIAEAGFIWAYFMVLFMCVDELRRPRLQRHFALAPAPTR